MNSGCAADGIGSTRGSVMTIRLRESGYPRRPTLLRYPLRPRATLPGRFTWIVDLEQTLAHVVELSREELSIARKRAEEKTPARDHGHDYHEMQRAADRLDHYAHLLRRLHDEEFGSGWRHESEADAGGGQ
jgi:hypothetical protein